jgi:hypothetical protein
MKTQRMIDQELDLISNSHPTTRENKILLKWLGKVWQVLVMLVTKESEMRIWQSCDCAGNTWWHIYNPAIGKSATLLSEEELIDWIEQSYYKQEKTNYSLNGWTKFGNF